jgi:acetyltransferase-like isoleucine patch superfamily enzyme
MSALRIMVLKARCGERIEVGFDTYIGPRCRIHVARGGLLRLRSVYLDRDVLVSASPGAVVEVGPRGRLGTGSMVSAQQRVVLGEGTRVGEYVAIRDHDHVHDAQHPLVDSHFTRAPIVLGENVWVGSKATIVAGVTIGDHALVAANAVVTRDVKPGERVGGVPARPLPRPAQLTI